MGIKNDLTGRYVASVPAPLYPDGRYRGWSACVNWLDNTIGEKWYYVGEGVFEFNTEQEYVAFMLKWA